MSEYERAQNAFHAIRERLKAERLAREAAAVQARHKQNPELGTRGAKRCPMPGARKRVQVSHNKA